MALHNQAILQFLHHHAEGGQALGHRRDAIAFLDPQFTYTPHHRGTLGKSGQDSQDGIFIDHRRRAFGRHLNATKLAMAHTQIGNWFTLILAAV